MHAPERFMALPYYNPSQNAPVQHQLSPVARRRGYAQVAEFIATDKELAIYHRFDRTAARILLMLQSEILYKQKQLDEIDAEDAIDTDEKRRLASGTILEEFRGDDARDLGRKELYWELKKLLKEYCRLDEREIVVGALIGIR